MQYGQALRPSWVSSYLRSCIRQKCESGFLRLGVQRSACHMPRFICQMSFPSHSLLHGWLPPFWCPSRASRSLCNGQLLCSEAFLVLLSLLLGDEVHHLGTSLDTCWSAPTHWCMQHIPHVDAWQNPKDNDAIGLFLESANVVLIQGGERGGGKGGA